MTEIAVMVAASRRPALYVGVGVRRHGLTRAVVRLAERLGLPVVTDLLGKAAFPESHPQYAGVYLGALCDPAIRELLDGSDCVLEIGVMPTDVGTGFWTQRIDPKARVMIDPDGVQVRYHRYDALPMAEVVAALLDRIPSGDQTPPRFDRPAFVEAVPMAADSRQSGVAKLKVAEVIAALQGLDQSRYSFVTDVGDSWFIGLELRADVFVAAGYYSSMGFAVPAALGAGLAEPSRRPFVIVGDGAFQMTGIELATHVEQGLRPIVLLLNNGGYGMLEAIDRPRTYFERRSWDYPAMARSLGAEAERSHRPGRAGRRIASGGSRPRGLPYRGVHREGRSLAGDGPDPDSCPHGLQDPDGTLTGRIPCGLVGCSVSTRIRRTTPDQCSKSSLQEPSETVSD